MRLIMLGTGGFMPTDQAQTACYMLPEVGVLLDAGTGLYRMSAHIQREEIDVYLSHAHGDHTSGLIYLFAARVARDLNRCANIDSTVIMDAVTQGNRFLHAARIHASQPTLESLSAQYADFHMAWLLLQAQEPLRLGGKLTSFQVGEGEEVGFRLDWPGHSIAYVTDTVAGPQARYLEHLRGVDVLLHDCNGPDQVAAEMTRIHHSHTSAVAQLAARAGVGRLFLIHSAPVARWNIADDLEAARKIFPHTAVGRDGMEIEF